jgi:hypothetical protein
MDVKKKAMIDALQKNLGNVTLAAKSIDIDRTTHYVWMNNDIDYANQINDIDNIVLDFAESSLFKQIKEGNVTATIFLLKTRGKSRGYVEKNELNLSGELKQDSEITIKFANGNYPTESA